VDKPKLHLWETGIMRVTRHPQASGRGVMLLRRLVCRCRWRPERRLTLLGPRAAWLAAQMVGQGLWCLAHTLWMGSSVSLVRALAPCSYQVG
jgi:uncharacterized membrane protein